MTAVTALPASPPLWTARHALWAYGFRPFYLLAALQAVIAVPLWLLARSGTLPIEPALGGALWHAHEMLFGFTAAVLVGFLYTAIPNWTGRPTPRHGALFALALLWLAGRIALLAGGTWPPLLVAGLDLAFLPAAAAGMLPPLVAARNRRNIAFPFVLLALAAVNGALHAQAAGLWQPPLPPLTVVLAVITLILVIMTGRVVPFFTANALPAAGVTRQPRLDSIATAATALALALAAIRPEGWPTAAGLIAAGLLLLARQWFWRPWATRQQPMLWVLHLGHAWIAAGLLLLGLTAAAPDLPASAAIHALTVGAVGTLVLGMIARTALGHTGRPIVASRRLTAAFGLLTLAAVLRSFGPLLCADDRLTGLYHAAGLAWSLAFVLYLADFVPILLRPRADGRPG